ncbi:MAG: zinc metallopeptidase [bacterium]|nr:zinc metallopeptidase [bacterium]
MAFAYILFFVIAAVSYYVQYSFQNKFKKYSSKSLGVNMTGKDVAERMLRDYGVNDVKVTFTQGSLSDHYNPTNKTVNLSEAVFATNSIAAAAVAAHECGHAIQHATGYAPLQLRSKLVPVVSFASTWMQWILLIGILTIQVFPQILTVGVALFACTTIFAFITLPVEINASVRALKWLEASGLTYGQTTNEAKDALKSAAYTYVVAALSSLATLFYYVMILVGRNRD